MTEQELRKLVCEELENHELYKPFKLQRDRSKSSKTKDASGQGVNPLDDENSLDVPQGGEWGIPGQGQSPNTFRTRFGKPGIYDASVVGNKKVEKGETEKVAVRSNQIKPDRLIAYSRGASVYNQTRRDEPDMPTDIPVTYLAPSSYRKWSDAPVPKAPPGSVTVIGDQDKVVPFKQACKNAVSAGTRMYVQPGYTHTGIMYSGGDIDQDAFEIDAQSCVNDDEMPDWGKAAAGGSNEDAEKQLDRIKQHIKAESLLRKVVKSYLA